jgi:hypothetical protein
LPVSRPFAPPETGKIAIKVINHYGDEVLKVFETYPALYSALEWIPAFIAALPP